MNFGGIDPEYCAFDASTYVVIPVPYDLTTTYQSGSRKGPQAILDASCNMELYDEELDRETFRAGIHTLPPIEIEAGSPEGMTAAVEKKIAGVFAAGKIPVMLGGEHSISVGAVRAASKIYPSLSVLHLDAHADLRDAYQGTPFSHACAGRRISEICSLVQAGIRSMSQEEALFLKGGSVRTYLQDEILADTRWKENICSYLSSDVYITLDLDVLDPSIMPATGTPEPGGMQWRELLALIRYVTGRCNVRGFDVVELLPIPGIVAPDFLAAKLIYRMMGYVSEGISLKKDI
jgi:agmatinase